MYMSFGRHTRLHIHAWIPTLTRTWRTVFSLTAVKIYLIVLSKYSFRESYGV